MKLRDRCLLFVVVALACVLLLPPALALASTALASSRSARVLALLARLPVHPHLSDVVRRRGGDGRGDDHVEEACSGWVATLAYCSTSPSPETSLSCVCSEAALAQLARCDAALPAVGAIEDFARFCGAPERPNIPLRDPTLASTLAAASSAALSARPDPTAARGKKRRRILR